MLEAAGITLDVVLLTPRGRQLAVLLRPAPARGRARWSLPWDVPRSRDSLFSAAERIARQALGEAPRWLEQVGAFADGQRHPSGAPVSIAYLGLVPAVVASGDEAGDWFPISALPELAPRQRAMVDAAVAAARARVDQAPIAFRLLPDVFTLSELQEIYELLLGRQLHKASFRRALQAAHLVEPTEEWRSEGRGRPAQLFRYAPRRRRVTRRSVRFDLLGG